jgi:L-2-hydroxyglutarate oxidase LhgO
LPISNERPIGRDRAKKQRASSSSVNSSSCFDILQKIQRDRAKFEEDFTAVNKDECDQMSLRYERKLAIQEQHLQIASRSALLQEKILMLHEKEREDRLMTMDLDKFSPWVCDDYINQQKLIAAKSAE